MQSICKFICLALAIALPLSPTLFGNEKEEAPSSETMAAYILKSLNEREQAAYAKYERAMAKEDIEAIRDDLQSIVDGYDKLIGAAPEFAPAFTSYGMMLMRIGEREAAAAMFTRADELDPNIPLVKNQIGNYLAEEGKYAEALGFYLMATRLEPKEPLYLLQIGNLLVSYKNFFVDDKMYEPDTIDLKIQELFRNAAMLAPHDMRYRLRYAQSFFDIARPDWEAGIEEWQQLVDLAEEEADKQLIKLYMARARFEMGHHSAARKILKQIDHPDLEKSKSSLIDQLNEKHPN